MRYFSFILASFSLMFSALSGPGPVAMQDKLAAVAVHAFPAVVVIHSLQYSSNGAGSGFIIHESGIVVTNWHVIEKAVVLAVKDIRGNVFLGKIVGYDRDVDLAVLKIDSPAKFPKLTFADTDSLKVGHFVIAIGAPFRLEHTMTTGIVSHKNRKLGLNRRENFIQTDASINPGNSGGPLLDLEGKVVGVNDCIVTSSDRDMSAGNIGLGFAIDAKLVKLSIATILRKNSLERPYAGIMMVGSDHGNKPMVKHIAPGSPAEKTSLREGDIILQIDSRKVSTIQDVQAVILAFYDQGDEAEIIFRRDGKILKTKITFGAPK